MGYSIEKLSSKKFFIKLISRDWDFIINEFLSFFDNVYGDKFKRLKRLKKLYILLFEYRNNFSLYNKKDINLIIEKIILLGYNLVDNSKRKILISEYLSLYNIIGTDTIESFKINDNKKPINSYFLLGLILVDGNIYVRIRKTTNLPWFIPSLRVGQKITEDNLLLLNNIKNVLDQYKIYSNISAVNHLYVISINHINNMEKISK